jgi:hypothetical protein
MNEKNSPFASQSVPSEKPMPAPAAPQTSHPSPPAATSRANTFAKADTSFKVPTSRKSSGQ